MTPRGRHDEPMIFSSLTLLIMLDIIHNAFQSLVSQKFTKEEVSPRWSWLDTFIHNWRWSSWETSKPYWCFLSSRGNASWTVPPLHGGTVYRQMTVVSSAKTASKKLFKQKTPLFALDFNTKMVFIKGKFCFDRVHVHLSR